MLKWMIGMMMTMIFRTFYCVWYTKEVCDRNGESCSSCNLKSLCYKDLQLLPVLTSKVRRRKHIDFMQRFYATVVKVFKEFSMARPFFFYQKTWWKHLRSIRSSKWRANLSKKHRHFQFQRSRKNCYGMACKR